MKKLIKFLWKIPYGFTIENFETCYVKAVNGPIFRTGATIWHPSLEPPYKDTNWQYKILGFVLFNRALLSITVKNPI